MLADDYPCGVSEDIAMAAQLTAAMTGDVRQALPLIHAPTVVFHRSPAYQWVPQAMGRYLAEHIPGARFLELDGADSWIYAKSSPEAYDVIEEVMTGGLQPANPTGTKSSQPQCEINRGRVIINTTDDGGRPVNPGDGGDVQIWMIVLAAVAGAALIALAVTSVRLRRTRRELDELRASLRQQPRTGPVATTGRVVRAVVQGAARLREEGLSGMLSGSLDELAQWARDDRAAIVRVAAPDGSVTFFFSDIQDSTALNERLGDEKWLPTLHAHNDVVRRHIERHGGHVVKTVGDGFMAVFGDPVAGTDAAGGIHRSLAASRNRRLRHTPITVRIGIHTGTAVSRDGDYFGRNVALAARVAAHATGGQTLVTAAVHDALADHPTVRATPCGPVELKGIAEPVEIWSVAP